MRAEGQPPSLSSSTHPSLSHHPSIGNRALDPTFNFLDMDRRGLLKRKLAQERAELAAKSSPQNQVEEASPTAPSEAGNDGGDDDDVILERENSAWDALEERFKRNAAEGNYIDLTVEGGRKISETKAAETFEAIRQSGEASSTVNNAAVAAAVAAVEPSSDNNAVLNQLGNLIQKTVKDLQNVRGNLMTTMQENKGPRASAQLRNFLASIGRTTHQIQRFVNRNIEKMNLLVMKANTLITAINQKGNMGTLRSPMGKKRRGNGGGGSPGGRKRYTFRKDDGEGNI